MSNKFVYSFVMLAVIAVVLYGVTKLYLSKEDTQTGVQDVTVVTSFYPMHIACENILQDISGIRLENLSEPQTGCLHDFQLTPEDMRLLSTADVLVINGAGAESFIADVIAQYPELMLINASGLEQEEDAWMHGWMSPDKYMQEIRTITHMLGHRYPSYMEQLERNETSYLAEIEELSEQINQLRDQKKSDKVILFSEAYEVLAEDLGLTVVGRMDLDEERQISSGEVADIVQLIAENTNCFILAEELYGSAMGTMVSQQTGAAVIYLDTLTRGEYDKRSYVKGMQNNLKLLKEHLLP